MEELDFLLGYVERTGDSVASRKARDLREQLREVADEQDGDAPNDWRAELEAHAKRIDSIEKRMAALAAEKAAAAKAQADAKAKQAAEQKAEGGK